VRLGRVSTPRIPAVECGKFRYLEVFAKLEVADAVEADFERSDVLDVLIVREEPPAYPFSL
jgi:hypothetical protein